MLGRGTLHGQTSGVGGGVEVAPGLRVEHRVAALQAQGGLSEEEYNRWLDSLMAQGRWGEAYARWASGAPSKRASTSGRSTE